MTEEEQLQRVQGLAHSCLLALNADATPPGIAALAQEAFPAAAALRCRPQLWVGCRRRRCGAAVTVSAAADRLRTCCGVDLSALSFLPPTLPSTRRINVITGDPQVLASVGSLLAPSPLALSLLPLHASAAGAAVVRSAPVYLTEEGRQAWHTKC